MYDSGKYIKENTDKLALLFLKREYESKEVLKQDLENLRAQRQIRQEEVNKITENIKDLESNLDVWNLLEC